MNKRNNVLLLSAVLVIVFCICLLSACKQHTEHTYGDWETTREIDALGRQESFWNGDGGGSI